MKYEELYQHTPSKSLPFELSGKTWFIPSQQFSKETGNMHIALDKSIFGLGKPSTYRIQ